MRLLLSSCQQVVESAANPVEDVRSAEENGFSDGGSALGHSSSGPADGGPHVVGGAHHGLGRRLPVEAVDAAPGVVDEAAGLLDSRQQPELLLHPDRLLDELGLLLLDELRLLLDELRLLWLSELRLLLDELRLLLHELLLRKWAWQGVATSDEDLENMGVLLNYKASCAICLFFLPAQ